MSRFIQFVASSLIGLKVLLWAAVVLSIIAWYSEIGQGISDLFDGITVRIDHAIGYKP